MRPSVFTGVKGVLVTAYSKSQDDGVGYAFVSFEKPNQSDVMSENAHTCMFGLVSKVWKVVQPTLTSGGGGSGWGG